MAFPSQVFSVQVKSGACYITGQWGQVQNKIDQTLTLTLNLLFFIIKCVFLSWFGYYIVFGFIIFTAYIRLILYEEEMSVRPYASENKKTTCNWFQLNNILCGFIGNESTQHKKRTAFSWIWTLQKDAYWLLLMNCTQNKSRHSIKMPCQKIVKNILIKTECS